MFSFRWIATDSVGKLTVTPRPAGFDDLQDDLKQIKKAGVDVVVSMLGHFEADSLGLELEAEMCSKVGLDFIQAPIVDRSVPETPKLVYELASKLHSRIERGDNVLIHCRMGIGRSSVMAACVMSLQGISPTDAFERITVARRVDVPDTLEQKLWVESFAATFSSRPQTS